MADFAGKYGYAPDTKEALAQRANLFEDKLSALMSQEVLRNCFSLMDLTTLHTDDTEESVAKLVARTNALLTEYPEYPLPASICVFPNFAPVVKKLRARPELHVTTVSSCFPSAQSFIEVKMMECRMAVRGGADEVDIVLALNAFLAGDYERAASEIVEMKKAIDEEASAQHRNVVLKVILETGLLKTPELIADASFLAMEAGADFIKTSTGKVDVNATPEAAIVMCECIKRYCAKTGRKVGFKAAGGISTAKDALMYYAIGQEILGREWMNRDLFRFGVSRLGNSLMEAIEGKTVKYF